MKKNFISSFFDSVFYSLVIFIISFFIFNYFFVAKIGFILALTLSLSFGIVIFRIIHQKGKANNLSKTEQEELSNFTTLLGFLKRKDILLFLEQLKGGEIKNGRLYNKKTKEMISFVFNFSVLTKTDIVKEYNALPKNYTSVIYYTKCENETLDFANKFNKKIIVKDAKTLFLELKKSNLLPKNKCPIKEKGRTYYDFSLLLNKKTAPKLLLFGAVTLFFSLFVPYKTYYLIVGGIFILLALINKTFGSEKNKISD